MFLLILYYFTEILVYSAPLLPLIQHPVLGDPGGFGKGFLAGEVDGHFFGQDLLDVGVEIAHG